jgi:hypothetical protein
MIGDRRVLLLRDLLDRLSSSLGYAQPAPASDLVGKLNNRGLITKMNITDSQRDAFFPKGKRTAAVFLNPEGEVEFQNFVRSLEEATGEFLSQLPAHVRDQFSLLFLAPEIYESLVPVLQEAFLTGPDEEKRFMAASTSFLATEAFEDPTEITRWYHENVAGLPKDKLGPFLDEFERSVASTPGGGQQRRAGVKENTEVNKLMEFLESLVLKYR